MQSHFEVLRVKTLTWILKVTQFSPSQHFFNVTIPQKLLGNDQWKMENLPYFLTMPFKQDIKLQTHSHTFFPMKWILWSGYVEWDFISRDQASHNPSPKDSTGCGSTSREGNPIPGIGVYPFQGCTTRSSRIEGILKLTSLKNSSIWRPQFCLCCWQLDV